MRPYLFTYCTTCCPCQLGPKELFQYHEELKSLKTKHSDAVDSLQRKRKELEDLERANNLLKRDVERFKNKEKHEKHMRSVILKKLWVQYEDVSEEFRVKRRERKAASEEVKAIKDHYQPIRDQHKSQEDAVVAHQNLAKNAMREVHRAENLLRDHQDKLKTLADQVEEPRQELENLKKQEADRKKRITSLRREIEVRWTCGVCLCVCVVQGNKYYALQVCLSL